MSCRDLEESEDGHIAKLFLRDDFRCYLNFTRIYDKILETLSKLDRRAKNFVEKKRNENKDIMAFFILPVQRFVLQFLQSISCYPRHPGGKFGTGADGL